MTGDTPAVFTLVDTVGLSIVAAGAARPSEDLGKSSESEEQGCVFEYDESHAVALRYRETTVMFKRRDIDGTLASAKMRKERMTG
jgi:hypothetical protein